MSDTSAALHIRGFDAVQRTADFIASTDAIDSYGERVEQSWDLKRYLANPVVLFGHNSRDLPIGHAEVVEVRDGKLQIRVRFASEKANPMAEKVWQSIQEKTLRAVSVGFVPRTVKATKEDGREVYVLSDNELHEVSVVPIPANPEALAKMKAKAIAEAREAAPTGSGSDKAATRREEQAMEVDSKAALEAKEKALAEAHGQIVSVNKELTEARAAKVELEAKLATAQRERDEALTRAKTAEAAVVAVELTELTGTHIAPAEVDGLKELAALNPALYQRQLAAIKQRAPMQLLGEVAGGDKAGTNHAQSAGAGDQLVALMAS